MKINQIDLYPDPLIGSRKVSFIRKFRHLDPDRIVWGDNRKQESNCQIICSRNRKRESRNGFLTIDFKYLTVIALKSAILKPFEPIFNVETY